MYRAVHGLAKKKAAGPDGYMAEVYQNLPSVLKPLQDSLNIILETGKLHLLTPKLHIAPLDKPHRDPEECSSKRPISFLNTLPKVLETLVLARMVNSAEMHLDGRQYAYHPDRGAKTQLTEFRDFAREAESNGSGHMQPR